MMTDYLLIAILAFQVLIWAQGNVWMRKWTNRAWAGLKRKIRRK